MFPNAQVKIVSFELLAVGGDQRGKQRARELHRDLLAKIQTISGAAIVTYVTPSGDRIANHRVDTVKVARDHKAQMALWGQVLADKSGKAFINARLALITVPPGIEASHALPSPATPGSQLGRIQAPVTDLMLDFNTLESDVQPLVTFVSGIARYYKANPSGSPSEQIRWLKQSALEFETFVAQVPAGRDAARVADALVYQARGHVRLSALEKTRAVMHLQKAREQLERAARLDPYDPDVPAALAVVAVRQGRSAAEVQSVLVQAVTLAPADAQARLNLAVVQSARGDLKQAIRQVDDAQFVHKAQNGGDLKAARPLREELLRQQPQRGAETEKAATSNR